VLLPFNDNKATTQGMFLSRPINYLAARSRYASHFSGWTWTKVCSQHINWTAMNELIWTDRIKSTQLQNAFFGHARQRRDYAGSLQRN